MKQFSVVVAITLSFSFFTVYVLNAQGKAMDEESYEIKYDIAFDQCVTDFKAFHKLKGFETSAFDKCDDILAGRAVM